MRTIIGLVPKRHGTIEVFGIDLAALSDRERRAIEQRWGVLFQQGALFSSLTALQNVQFPMREYLDLSPRLMDEIALAKLEMVGLSADVRGKYPAELSGGMIKRVALARALALDPDIVFLDEPTSGLDPIGAAEFDELIRTLQRTLGLERFHGHPRSRQPARGLRPHRRPVRRARDRGRSDRDHARIRASVAQILFRRQARARQVQHANPIDKFTTRTARETSHGDQGQLHRHRRIHARRHRRRVRLHLLGPERRRAAATAPSIAWCSPDRCRGCTPAPRCCSTASASAR